MREKSLSLNTRGPWRLLVSILLVIQSGSASGDYPNGADGGDGSLDSSNGFFSESRQLDFDFLTNILSSKITMLIPRWNDSVDPLWEDVTHQSSSSFYNFDNNGNGITDTDQLDVLAAIMNGGGCRSTKFTRIRY